MKTLLRNIVMMVIAGVSLTATAQTQSQPYDTIYFYETWEQMIYLNPAAFIVNPMMYAESSCEIYIETGNNKINEMISDKYIALSQGDSIFLINSQYLKNEFKGDVPVHDGYVPLFFNEKVAFILSYGPMTVRDVLFGNTGEDGYTSRNIDYHYIDFVKLKVKRVTHRYLSELLEDYHDLQMRYEGMKDYKKEYIIEDYFFKFIDRATDDFMHPYILDLVK